MKKNPLKDGVISENSAGVGTVTRKMVQARAAESERWDPVPGLTGHKVRVAPSEDEDDEGRSDNERLVEGGIAEAEIEQSFQATKAAAKRDL